MATTSGYVAINGVAPDRYQGAVLGNLGDDYVKGQGGTRDTIAGGEGSDMVFGLASEIDEAFTVSSDLMSELDAV